MNTLIYQLAIWGYSKLIWLLAPFHHKAKLLYQGRQWSKKKLIQSSLLFLEHPTIWFHCASLGEFEQGRPLIEAFKEQFPQYKIVLTFFSPSGYEVRKNYPIADLVCYLPADTPKNAELLYKAIQPSIAIFVKYEFWHFYINEMKKQGVHLLCVSALFREKHKLHQRNRTFLKDMIQQFNHLFVQDEASIRLLKKANILQTSISGDTRFDRVVAIQKERKSIPIAESFVENHFTLVVGSAWLADLAIIAPVLSELNLPIKVIIAPHEINESNLSKIERLFSGKSSIRYSQYTSKNDADILMIDNIGMLSSLYQYADIAFIGGGFGKGIHNILEAAVYGIPVLFGPHHQRFKEALDLIAISAGFSVKTYENFKNLLYSFMKNEGYRTKVGKLAANYVNQNTGATQKIMRYLHENLPII